MSGANTEGLQAFADLTELLSEAVGGKALWCSDDWFASVHNLVKAEPAVFDPDAYCDTGKVMDGWESRRRRVPGHDTAILQLGLPGKVRGVDIDTAWFMGNHPPFGAVDAAYVEGDPTVEQLRDEVDWVPLTGQVPLQRGSHNLFAVSDERVFTHVRLHMLPDGGVARLRVYGEPKVEVEEEERLDLAALVHGGRPVGCSDMFFSPMTNLIAPGQPVNMGGGWETRRRRDDGADWIVVELGVPGVLEEVVLHTTHFKGNYPDRASLYGLWWPDAPDATLLRSEGWTPLFEGWKLGPDAEHRIPAAGGPFTHLKLVIHPCGGVARMRAIGMAAVPNVASDRLLSWLATASDDERLQAFSRCCGSTRWARRMVAYGGFGSREELHGAADAIWWDLGDGDWREAFTHHPRIGADVDKLREKFAATASWSEGEQSAISGASERVLEALAEANRAYESRFGYLFIVCATGKSAEEMLGLLQARMDHPPANELRIAAGEQAKITHLRLEKLP